ncbi:MAG: DUF819 family protein [Halioglobus sp.]|nr:DUF819 family protein [Halioglobus sp.]
MTSSLVFVACCLCVPAAILWLTHHQQWASRIGVIVLCYLAGMLAGNAGVIPERVLPLQNQVTDLSIALAMPLLLFTLDIRQWRRVAGRAMLSMLFATTAVVTMATCLFFLFRDSRAESASHFAAMSVGVYTGGTPNLAAIKSGLDIPNSEYIIFHSLDTLLGSFYLIGMLTVGIPFFRSLLPTAAPASRDTSEHAQHFDSDDYSVLLRSGNVAQMLQALALALLVVAAAWGISTLLAQLSGTGYSAAGMIVALTTLGIALSLVPAVRRLQLAYKIGMYLIYVFCFTVASMASFEQLAGVDPAIALFLVGTICGSLLLHCLLCRALRIDSDTFMVTSVAAVCSPPFVPMMARALGNPSTILSGMTTGIIGYALGNYLGISLGLLLQGL